MSIQIGDPSRVAAVSGRARRWAGALILGGALAVLAVGFVRLATYASTYVPRTPGREPVALHPTGDFTHPTAGFALPEKAGPFVREEVIQYDEAGRDILAGYNALIGKGTPLPVVVTVYVYPVRPGAELDAYFDQLLTDIGRMHGSAKPQFRNPILLADGRFNGRYAAFGYEERWGGVQHKVPLRSYLVLYQWKGWWVKWRVTTPAPVSKERMTAIVKLTETLLPPEDQPDQSASPSESLFGPERQAALIFYSTKLEMGLGREPFYPHADSSEYDSPYKVAGRILQELRQALEEEVGEDALRSVVVTVPASFQLAARKDTIRAARLAGLELREQARSTSRTPPFSTTCSTAGTAPTRDVPSTSRARATSSSSTSGAGPATCRSCGSTPTGESSASTSRTSRSPATSSSAATISTTSASTSAPRPGRRSFISTSTSSLDIGATCPILGEACGT